MASASYDSYGLAALCAVVSVAAVVVAVAADRQSPRPSPRPAAENPAPVTAPQTADVPESAHLSSDEGSSPTTREPAPPPALVASIALVIAREESDAARVLVEAARELYRPLDPTQVAQLLLSRAMPLARASAGSVMLLQPDTRRLAITAAEGLPDDVVRDTSVRPGEGIAGMVFATGMSRLVEDAFASTPSPGASPRTRRGLLSAISVPIADEDGALGVLNVGSTEGPESFAGPTIVTLESLAQLAATALRNASVIRSTGELYFDALKTLALALETKDPFSHGGTERVVGCATALGAAMGLDQSEARSLEIAALLHDIGMIATGDASSIRHRPLTTVEWGLLKMHPVVAAELLEQAPTLRDVAPIVYHHHEHYDGSGYTSGLAGDDIPLASRVLSVADAYVAMTSERSYRPALTMDEALAELDEKAGTQFDPHVVAALRDIVDADENQAPAWHV